MGRSAAPRLSARLALTGVLTAGLALAASAGPAGAVEAEVDLELVLAVDISYSMDVDEQQVQRDGYAAAIVSPQVIDAIGRGLLGRIAVAYVEWAGAEEQRVVVPWTLIDGPDGARDFAAALAAAPLRRAYRTSISGALAHAARMFDGNGFRGLRTVIDVSGDGPNNQGEPVEAVRDDLLEHGVVINGLPLMMKRPSVSMMDIGDLDAYYRDCVIGGPGAFMVPVRGVEQFPDAVRTKLVLEIAGPGPDAPVAPPVGERAIPAADPRGPTRVDCASGEQLWRERFGN